MKKLKALKALKGALIGVFVVAAACCIFTACSSKSESDSTPITAMTLSIDNVKRTYLTYQSFSTEGLEAEVMHESGKSTTVKAKDLTIDDSAFNNSTGGEYEIVVSYTEGYNTVFDSYTVEVIDEVIGLVVEKDTVEYTVTSASGVDIGLNDMKVYSVDASGVSASPLSSGSYELKYYKGGEEISSVKGLSAGVYTIYAYNQKTIQGKYSKIDYEYGGYVIVYVIDTPVSITLNSGAVTTQDFSVTDEMTPTWIFTLTYSSGITVELTANEVTISGVSTTRPTEDGETSKAYVSYSEMSASTSGHVTNTVSCEISYTITAAPGSKLETVYALDIDSMLGVSGELADKTTLKGEWFTGVNAFLTFTENSSNQYRSGGYFDIKGDGFSVTFDGTGSLVVGIASTGGSNWSNMALRGPDNTYLKGSMQEDAGKIQEYVLSDGKGYTYEVYGTTETAVTFDITVPGTYSIVTAISECSEDEVAKSNPGNRATRIYSIVMTDIITYGETVTNSTALRIDLYSEESKQKSF